MKTKEQKLIRWIENLPEDILIDYRSPDNCVLCQFMRDCYGLIIKAGPFYYKEIEKESWIDIEESFIEFLRTARNSGQGDDKCILTKSRLLLAYYQVYGNSNHTSS